MDWKLLFSTFALIFFAELGDKTQLAAMASAAGSKSVASVFIGASLALVMSTLIAVAIGGVVQKYVPDYIVKFVAAAIFLTFGLVFLISAFKVHAARPTPEKTEARAPSGWVSHLIMDMAANFEQAAADDYEALAEKVDNPQLRSLFQTLAEEEREHLASVRRMSKTHAVEPHPEEEAPKPMPRFLWAHGELLDKEMEILAAAIHQEKSKVDFYQALAESSHLPSVKQTFEALAAEEQSHVERLQKAGC
ncbi:MAG: TMEM165/GDT1 family protein [Candidatus Sumerlaeia bacterium]